MGCCQDKIKTQNTLAACAVRICFISLTYSANLREKRAIPTKRRFQFHEGSYLVLEAVRMECMMTREDIKGSRQERIRTYGTLFLRRNNTVSVTKGND